MKSDIKADKMPEHLLKGIFCKLTGAMLIVAPLLMLASVFDYHATDRSLNQVSSEATEIQNFLGIFGSYSADFILSSFGLSLMLFLLVPIFWGINLLRRHEFLEWKMRIFAWLVGIVSFACFIDLSFRSYLGKFNLPHNLAGDWTSHFSSALNSYANYLTMLKPPYNKLILLILLLFLSLMAFNFAAGITFRFWLSLLQKVQNIGNKFLHFGIKIFKKAAHIRSFNEFKEINPSYMRTKMQNKLNNLYPRREPEFERKEPTMNNQTLNTTTSLTTQLPETLPVTSAASGPKIVIPNRPESLSAPIAAADKETRPTADNTKKSVNPTFDFINEPQVMQKKPTAKISPQDIYHTEGVRTTAMRATAKPNAVQEELLNIPTSAPAQKTSLRTPMEQRTETAAKVAVPQTKNDLLPQPQTEVYTLPSIDLLSAPKNTGAIVVDENALKERAARLEQVLNDFNIHGQIVAVRPGPVVTLYELEPKAGTRTARVIGLSDDIARSMAVSSVRMAVVAGHSTIGIELPNEKRQTVWIRELFEDNEFMTSKNILNVALGKDIGGQHVYADLSKMPHLLVAGTTGSGKSVGVNTMILSLLYRMTPDQCRFIMIDPKQLEFSMYNGIPHLLTPVITDPAKAVVGLKWAVQEMENRYRQMALLNVRNIAGYNKKIEEMQKTGKGLKKTIQTGFDKETGQPIYEEQIIDTSPMPYIVIVVDEMADLMLVAGKEVEAAIQRLAQMARAAGIHLIMSTQRPSVDVITGVIKSNFPSRISFHVTTKIDSGTILGEKGAEQLLGMGDMLFMSSGSRPVRVHGCFVADEEVERVVEFIKSQGEPQYVSEVTAGELNTKDSGPVFDKGDFGGGTDEEDLYRQAVEIVRTDKKASTSYVQRKLRIGYNRAANLIERMEQEGIVSKQDHVGRREVLGVD